MFLVLVCLNYLSIKESWRKWYSIHKNIKQQNSFQNQYIRLISEGKYIYIL